MLLCVSVDVQHGVCWSVHHSADGDLLHLHRRHLQRLLLQVTQHVRLWMERQAHVWPERSQLVVSQPPTLLGPIMSEVFHIPYLVS